MKHQILKSRFTQLILFMLFAFNAGISQIQIGPKAGMTFFKQSGAVLNETYNTSLVSGYALGASMEYTSSGRISLALDILYNQRGGFNRSKLDNIIIEVDGFPEEGTHQYQHRLTYLNLPLVAKYNFRGKTFALNLQAGLELGFLLNGNESKGRLIYDPTSPTGFIPFINRELNIGEGPLDEYLKSDFGIILGTGFFYQLDSGKLTFDLRYNLGVKNISTIGQNNVGNFDIKNNGYSIMLGYLFPFGGGY